MFAQAEPLRYPYVVMPTKARCVIKFPRMGRTGRRGYTEATFLVQLATYFQGLQLYNDRVLLVQEGRTAYEPDFTLIDEANGLNLFLDVEIDEPYEGSNDVLNRKPMHSQGEDVNRNNAFRNRGWIVVRFAEIQAHQQPEACCRFIADVIASINPRFVMPAKLLTAPSLSTIPQWTQEEALVWSLAKYREEYLGIPHFGETPAAARPDAVSETQLEQEMEAQVQDEPAISTAPKPIPVPSSPRDLIADAIRTRQYLTFTYLGQPTIILPKHFNPATQVLNAHCYVKNEDRDFTLDNMRSMRTKPSFYSAQLGKPALTTELVKALVQVAIRHGKYIRMTYTPSGWNGAAVETNIRTISDVHGSADVLPAEKISSYNLNNDWHISAHCHKREEQRTFHYGRISELAILDL